MAINKVIYGDQTLIDITDTTASTNDVLEGQVFYSAGGTRSVGTLSDATQSTHGLMSATDKIKLDGINLLGVKLNTTALTPDSNGYISIPLMTGATSSANGTAGLIPAPTTADAEKFFRGDGTWQDGGRPMVILSYGNSTWDDFITAYNNRVIVYCRASSNSNPKTGSQTRMAFMAYVNNADTPTEVEFQYYRSMSSHSATQMGDQVYVYKLTNKNAWTVTVREASVKQVNVSGSGLTASWSSNQVTLSNTMTAADMPMSSSDATTVGSAISDQSQAIADLSDKIDVESVTSLPFRTGIFYCSSTQTIGSVTIPNHFIYDIHVSGTTATGIAVRATTGAAYSLYGYEGAWVSAVELAIKSDFTVTSATKLVDSSVAVSGTSSWQSVTRANVSRSYKKYFIKCGVHGALYSSAIISCDELKLTSGSYPFSIQSYWDADNLGTLTIYQETGSEWFYIGGSAKTKSMTFDYLIFGMN